MMKRRHFIRHIAMTGAGIFMHIRKLFPFCIPNKLKKSDFGIHFIWGVATSAYQIEGAYNEDGKGMSIWDIFTKKKRNIEDHTNGNTACNFYHLYNSDIELIRKLNFSNFRFSLSWPRIFPEGTGKVNQKGIDFYHRVIDSCLDKGIVPWITLYHWDLPQALEDKGGWTNRDIVHWFNEYANTCAIHFGDRVKNWIVLNEPMAFTGLGYFSGYHAPGKRGLNKFLSAVHHAVLCQSSGGKTLKNKVKDAYVGTAFSCSFIEPMKEKPLHKKSAERLDALLNRLFIEPSLGWGYPDKTLPLLKGLSKIMKPGDDELMKFNFDFIGLQNYFRVISKFSFLRPLIWAKNVHPGAEETEETAMGWEIYPEGMYKIIKQFSKYPVNEIMVTENGAAFNDEVVDGIINDKQRIHFFRSYLENILRAKNEGIRVKGYFVWTLMDNFEWAEGFSKRFGIIYNDFETQSRTIKGSGYWFKHFLRGDHLK